MNKAQQAGVASSDQKIPQAIDYRGVVGTHSGYQKLHVATFRSQGLGQNQAKQVPVEPAHLGAPEVYISVKVLK